MSNERVVVDFQNFFESRRKDESEFTLVLSSLTFLFRIIVIFKPKSLHIFFHPHTSPPKLLEFLLKTAKFDVYTVNDYASIGEYLSSNTILVSKDPVFYQFLSNNHLTAYLASIYLNGDYQLFNSDYLEKRFGWFYPKDYELYACAHKSIRLNFPGIKRATVNQCYLFNQKVYRASNAHRFFSRSYFQEYKKKIILKPVNLSKITPINIDTKILSKNIDLYVPSLSKFCNRIIQILDKNRKD